jgi:hypothetical protein
VKIAYIGNKQTDRGRFLAKFLVDDGCWEWTEGSFPARGGQLGYGAFNVGNRPVQAHRFAYEMFKGEIPDDLVVMHSCDNPPCVNPAHLVLGTQSDNCRDRDDKKRGYQSGKTACKQGHPYDEENTGFRANGHRYCKTCTDGWNARYRDANPKEPKPRPKQPRTHCFKGHQLTEENIYHTNQGIRLCRTCARARVNAWRLAQKVKEF